MEHSAINRMLFRFYRSPLHHRHHIKAKMLNRHQIIKLEGHILFHRLNKVSQALESNETRAALREEYRQTLSAIPYRRHNDASVAMAATTASL
jgi:hypothetical protein